jgi:hypothetical protein
MPRFNQESDEIVRGRTRRGSRISNSSDDFSDVDTTMDDFDADWTEDDDEKLRVAVILCKEKNWKKIAEQIPGKTPAQCMHRYKASLNPDTLKVKGRWTPEVSSRPYSYNLIAAVELFCPRISVTHSQILT